MKKMKKLVIAPHIDDEVLGCGGILDSDTFVLHCGIEDRSYVSAETRIDEIKAVRKEAGFKMKLLRGNVVNHYNTVDLIPEIENAINKIKPEIVFIPFPSYNQDHRAVYEACLIATRQHDMNFFVKKVLVYEQPHVAQWNFNGFTFVPNYFIPINIEKKIKLYSLLKSQIRAFRSVSALKAMAVMRGAQINKKYAEAFMVLRWVE